METLTFQTAVNYGTAVNSISLCAADFDGDNDYDLAVSNNGSENISIIENLRIISGIDESLETYSPESFSISQNYPNPFNPIQQQKWQQPETDFITLKIYDILGREMTTLVNEELSAGKHEVTFDATLFSSGIYFYRLKAAGFIQTKKMLLLK